MTKAVLSGVGLLSIFLVSAVAHFPLHLMLKVLPLPDELELANPTGTIWQGDIDRVSWQNEDLGELSWTVSALKLLMGKAEAQVGFGRGSYKQLSGRGTIGYSFSGPYAENFFASMPIFHVMQHMPELPLPLDLTGEAQLNVEYFVYASPYCQSGQGSLTWLTDKIGTPLTELVTGPVKIDFTCKNSNLEFKGSQSSKQVASGAKVDLNEDLSFSADVWFKPQSEFPSQLTEYLDFLPDPDSEGKYQFDYQGNL